MKSRKFYLKQTTAGLRRLALWVHPSNFELFARVRSLGFDKPLQGRVSPATWRRVFVAEEDPPLANNTGQKGSRQQVSDDKPRTATGGMDARKHKSQPGDSSQLHFADKLMGGGERGPAVPASPQEQDHRL